MTFKIVDGEKRAYCNYCSKYYIYSSDNGTLQYHLLKKHQLTKNSKLESNDGD